MRTAITLAQIGICQLAIWAVQPKMTRSSCSKAIRAKSAPDIIEIFFVAIVFHLTFFSNVYIHYIIIL